MVILKYYYVEERINLYKKIVIACLILLSFSSAVAAARNIPAPENLTAQLATYSDGTPYFKIEFDVPTSIAAQVDKEYDYSEAGANYHLELEYRTGNGSWRTGSSFSSISWHNVFLGAEDVGVDGNIDIKANTYQIRARFLCHTFYPNEDGVRIVGNTYYSPYSNVSSLGVDAYRKYKNASTWAIPELDKAVEYGFITDKIKDQMNGPITREEFCELVVKLFEKTVGKAATYSNMNAFSDTKNPEIFKAYELGIVKGIGEDKFAPGQLVTREQIASMMHRAVKVIKPDADFSVEGAETYADEALISPWALESVKFMNKNGFMKGFAEGRFDPKGTSTREQAVVMAVRTFEMYAK
jgi:hypothetical protein